MSFRFSCVLILLIFVSTNAFGLRRSNPLARFHSVPKFLNRKLSALATTASSAAGVASDKKFASFVVYKGKAALSMKLVAPTWEQSSGGSTISREGGVFLEFAPSTGPKSYNWAKKSTFLMSASECGSLLAKFNQGVEFVHDPGAQSATAGQTTKRLKFAPAPDNNSLFVSLMVTSKTGAANAGSLSVPVSWGEFVVMENVIKYAMPYFLGFDTVFKQPRMDLQGAGTGPSPPSQAPYDASSASSEEMMMPMELPSESL